MYISFFFLLNLTDCVFCQILKRNIFFIADILTDPLIKSILVERLAGFTAIRRL